MVCGVAKGSRPIQNLLALVMGGTLMLGCGAQTDGGNSTGAACAYRMRTIVSEPRAARC